MSPLPYIRRFAILLLLFCMPFQLVSAAVLDCLHANGGSTTMKAMGCHALSQSSDADTETADNLTQCQKCALDLLLLAATSDIDLTATPLFIPVIDHQLLRLQAFKLFLPPLQRPPLTSGHI